jgi:hypothetical protein
MALMIVVVDGEARTVLMGSSDVRVTWSLVFGYEVLL